MQGLKLQSSGEKLNGVKMSSCEKTEEEEQLRKININQPVGEPLINNIISTIKVRIEARETLP